MAGPLFIAISLGAIPPLLWLLFWLRADREHPEPRSLIAMAFFAGMVAVPAVIVPQSFIPDTLLSLRAEVFWLSFLEETVKLLLVSIFILWRKAVDEPIDFVIYLIVTALGFAALENALYIAGPVLQGEFGDIIAIGNRRFIGANLLHVVASALVGVSLAMSYRQSWYLRITYLFFGLTAAIALHAFFNLSILQMNISSTENATLVTEATFPTGFIFVWLVCTVLLFTLEKIRHLPQPA